MTQEEKGKWFNALVGDELIAHLQYTIAAHVVVGTDYDSCKAEFEQHAADELEHMNILLEKMIQEHIPVNQGLISLIKNSYSGYEKMEGQSSKDLLLFHHQAEINAIRSYKAFIKALGDEDYGLRQKLRQILNDELEHRTDLEKVLSSVQNTKTLIPTEESALFSRKDGGSKAFSSLDRLIAFSGSSQAPQAPIAEPRQQVSRSNIKHHQETPMPQTKSAMEQAVEQNILKDQYNKQSTAEKGAAWLNEKKNEFETQNQINQYKWAEEGTQKRHELLEKAGIDPNIVYNTSATGLPMALQQTNQNQTMQTGLTPEQQIMAMQMMFGGQVMRPDMNGGQ